VGASSADVSVGLVVTAAGGGEAAFLLFDPAPVQAALVGNCLLPVKISALLPAPRFRVVGGKLRVSSLVME
jgi:hypothetical protein